MAIINQKIKLKKYSSRGFLILKHIYDNCIILVNPSTNEEINYCKNPTLDIIFENGLECKFEQLFNVEVFSKTYPQILKLLNSYEFKIADVTAEQCGVILKNEYQILKSCFEKDFIDNQFEEIIKHAFSQKRNELFFTKENRNYFSKKLQDAIEVKLITFLKACKFDKAAEYYQSNRDLFDAERYHFLYAKYLGQYINSLKSELQSLLESYKFDSAANYYQLNKKFLDYEWYRGLDVKCHVRYNADQFLQNYQFRQADTFYKQNISCFDNEEYITRKSESIRKYLSEKFNLNSPLDAQQCVALADVSDNQLVTARAGSGKTTVLTCKGMMLATCRYVQNPNAVLMLAFNRKAADEIKEKINIKHNFPLNNIRTFHSLAHRIVQPKQQDIKEDYEAEMAEYLKSLLGDDPRLKPYLYEFFRKEMEDIDYRGLLLNEVDYYNHARNRWESISLKGDRVKSYGEKCIADFLFEHGLEYEYEKASLVFSKTGQKVIYKPDFTITIKKDDDTKITFILEHWAIPEKTYYSDRPIWKRSKTTEIDYAEERQRKRNYWNREYRREKKCYLIETDISWLHNGRERFEEKLKKLLESNGIECTKLFEGTLLEKVFQKHSNRLFRLFVSFIQKSRRYGYSPEAIKQKRDSYETSDEKEKAFLRVAPDIYQKYEKSLSEKDGLDFDRLIQRAIDKIRTSTGDCYICDNKNNVNIKVKDIEYILIDEFQDFSKQFYNIISSIQSVNPNVKLFCVGDDWQAINSFAGSDIKYFKEFDSHYPETSERHILTNYRSNKNIVVAGNKLMSGLGKESICCPSKNISGTVEVIDMDDYIVEGRDNQSGTVQYENDIKYLKASEVNVRAKDDGEWTIQDYDTARYLKAIHSTLKDNLSLLSQKNTRCFVLTRNNRFGCFENTTCFKDRLLSVFSEDEIQYVGEERIKDNLHVMTAHKSKGKEADIVFVLKCNLRNFPMIHPDNRLFGIFGETEEKVLEEEKRLFYVALTRAKQQVYLLAEKDDISPFLEELVK